MTIKNIYQDLDLDDQDFKQDYIIFHNIYNTTAATAVECTTYDSYTKSIFRSKKYIYIFYQTAHQTRDKRQVQYDTKRYQVLPVW
jgi:hypothetical protein